MKQQHPVPITLRLVMMAALSLAAPLGAQADDGKPEGLTRLAAAGGTDPSPWRLGMPARISGTSIDLHVLLAQNQPTVKTRASNSDDTILVALPLGAPQALEEEIAVQHGLALVDRTELADLGLRIVQFRVSDDRAIEPILAALHKDQRIRRAQRNARYELPADAKPASGVAAAAAKAKPQTSARPNFHRSTRGSVRQRLAGPIATEGRPTTPSVAHVRVGNAGDVLSGGL